jgi:hypothetical protein
MLVNNCLVMRPFLLYITNVGTSIALNIQVGRTKGDILSIPLICSSFMSSIYFSNPCIPSSLMSSPSFDNGLKPHTSVTRSLVAAIMIAHITARPSADVNPMMVKWLSLHEFRTCDHMSGATMNFWPPALPSPFWEIFSPTSSIKSNFLGCLRKYFIFRPYASTFG